MKQLDPPVAATWLLEHLTPGKCDEALAGDLLQEYRNGRTAGWYWRQVLAAISIRWLSELVNHRVMLVFAALWSSLVPAWNAYVEKMLGHLEPIWRMNWPWSVLCAVGLSVAISLTFLWTGVLLYLVPRMSFTRRFNLRGLSHALLLSGCCFIAVSAGMLALMMVLPLSGHAIDQPILTLSIAPESPPRYFEGKGISETEKTTSRIDKHTGRPVLVKSHVWNVIDVPDYWPTSTVLNSVTPLDEITDIRLKADIARLPYFLGMLYALWIATSRIVNGPRKIVA